MYDNQNTKKRSNSYPSVREFIKRKKEKELTVGEGSEPEAEKIFKRSTKTSKSPIRKEKTDQEENMDELKKMLTALTGVVNDGFRTNNQKIDKVEERLNEMDKRWSEEIMEVKKMVQKLEEKTNGQEEKITKLELQLEKYEKDRKMSNIIIKNMPITGNITRGKVEEFISQGMHVQVEVVDAFNIGNREGKQVVVAKLKDHKQKTMVMENKCKLKGTATYIENDLTNKEKEIQNKIWDIAREEMKHGNKVKVGYQKMYKQEKVYTWDKQENRLKLKDHVMEEKSKN